MPVDVYFGFISNVCVRTADCDTLRESGGAADLLKKQNSVCELFLDQFTRRRPVETRPFGVLHFGPVLRLHQAAIKSGDNKGMIRDGVRYSLAPNHVRRHRVISISYIGQILCHATGRVR